MDSAAENKTSAVETARTEVEDSAAVINLLRDRGIREQVKVMIGGAPVDAEFAEKIGADAYGEDAAEAVTVARKFINK